MCLSYREAHTHGTCKQIFFLISGEYGVHKKFLVTAIIEEKPSSLNCDFVIIWQILVSVLCLQGIVH